MTENNSQHDISDALRRISADLRAGAHYPTVAILKAQFDALRYLVEQTTPHVQSWEPRNGNLHRDEVLAVLKTSFYESRPDVPETVPGAKGEPLDVSTPDGPGVVYRAGVDEVLAWVLSRLSFLSMDTVTGEVVRIQGWA